MHGPCVEGNKARPIDQEWRSELWKRMFVWGREGEFLLGFDAQGVFGVFGFPPGAWDVEGVD